MDLAPVHTARTNQQFLESGSIGLATIFAEFEFAGLLYLPSFARKVQATPHANLTTLHLSITAECDWLVAEYIRKTCPSYRHC